MNTNPRKLSEILEKALPYYEIEASRLALSDLEFDRKDMGELLMCGTIHKHCSMEEFEFFYEYMYKLLEGKDYLSLWLKAQDLPYYPLDRLEWYKKHLKELKEKGQ